MNEQIQRVGRGRGGGGGGKKSEGIGGEGVERFYLGAQM